MRNWWTRLTMATVLVAFALIVVGAVVRVEGAGLGCGDDWPTCNGAAIPTFGYETTIEYTHRLLASVVVLLTVGLVAVSWRLQRTVRAPLVRLALVALGLVVAQALLGAATVFVKLDPRMVMAHLGMAEAYFAVVLLLALVARAGSQTLGERHAPALGAWPLAAAGIVYVLLLSGAYTATSSAASACPEWPTCQGHYFPTGVSPVDIHLAHRWLALLALAVVGGLALRAWGVRATASGVAGLALGVVVLLVEQIMVGAVTVWTHLNAAVSLVHLANATLLWGLLVAIVVLERVPLGELADRPARNTVVDTRRRPAAFASLKGHPRRARD